MTVKEFYELTGGNYTDAVNRLMNDTLIKKFVLKFAGDPNFSMLQDAINDGDFDNAFLYSHTLKGVALNLAFSKLSESAIALTDALRQPQRASLSQENAKKLFEELQKDYNLIIENINKL